MSQLTRTVTTGVLGMNVFAEADSHWLYKLGLVVCALVGTTLITYLVLRRSQPLARFLEAIADSRCTLQRQWRAFKAVLWER